MWSWVFGSPFEGKVELTEELDTLLSKLEQIGRYKNELPLKSRGWCNSLGLYVQYREMGNQARLEAGTNEHKSDIDASIDYSSGPFDWKVKKYNTGDWEHLVNPTLDIAFWLQTHGGIPEQYALAFDEAIERYRQEGEFQLPDIGTKN